MSEIVSKDKYAYLKCPFCESQLTPMNLADELSYADEDFTEYYYRCPSCGALCQVSFVFSECIWRSVDEA